MSEDTGDHRIYVLGEKLGRLEGQMASLVMALQREHDERVAAMRAHEQRADATDKRVEVILDRLADQIGKLASNAEATQKEVDGLTASRGNSIDAQRWIVNFVLALLVMGTNFYAVWLASQRSLPHGGASIERHRSTP